MGNDLNHLEGAYVDIVSDGYTPCIWHRKDLTFKMVLPAHKLAPEFYGVAWLYPYEPHMAAWYPMPFNIIFGLARRLYYWARYFLEEDDRLIKAIKEARDEASGQGMALGYSMALQDLKYTRLYIIRKNVKHYPDRYVAQLHYKGRKDLVPTETILIGNTLEELRSILPQGMMYVDGKELNEPDIVGCWN